MTGIGRRALGITAAATLAAPRMARASGGNLNVVLESEVVILDPHATTANITRSFGYHVFDTLFATDEMGAIRPQMVEGHTVSADRLTWTFTLREGLAWHDGTPVTAADCVASLRRWMPKDALGRMLAAATATLEARDQKTFVLVLKQPFGMVLEILGKPNAIVPFMLPERLANIPGDQRITEIIGSGPFRFRRDLWRNGDRMVLEKFSGYVPRAEAPDFLAGGKVVNVDQMTWLAIPDQATAASALMQNEIDYQQYIPFDWVTRMERARGVKVMGLGGVHMFQGNYRLNHAAPPFDDPTVRRVLWQLVDQNEVLTAIGVPEKFRAPQCASFWMCDAPLTTLAGSEAAKFSIEAARDALKRTSYAGQPVVMLQVAGSISQTAARVLAQNMRLAGFTVDEQAMDWGTVLARRARKEGWGLFGVYSNGVDMNNPLTHFYVAATCGEFPGWSCDAAVPPLLADFSRAETLEERRAIAEKTQVAMYALTPSVMWGQFTVPAAYRDSLRNLIQSSFPMFWQVAKA